MSDQLPAWLTMPQAISWVLYRDPNLPEQKFYGPDYGGAEPERLGTIQEFLKALQHGRLTAYEERRGGEWREVPSREWMTRLLTPVSATDVTMWVSSKELTAGTLFPAKGRKVPANRQMDYDAIIADAGKLRLERPDISLGSAAASIAADLPPNPRTGNRRDARGIEKIIAHLWGGETSTFP